MCNKGITVRELYQFCGEQLRKGNGDKYVLISNDDEGNGYHTLFYQFTTREDCTNDIFASLLEMEHDGTHSMDDCVFLG